MNPFSSRLYPDSARVAPSNALQKEFLVRRSDIYPTKNPVKPSYKGKYHEQIKQEREAKRLAEESEHEKKAAMHDKKLNYGKFVN